MRVIEAQCSWSWRLAITPHIKHDRALVSAQIDPIGVPWPMICKCLSAAHNGGDARRDQIQARSLGGLIWPGWPVSGDEWTAPAPATVIHLTVNPPDDHARSPRPLPAVDPADYRRSVLPGVPQICRVQIGQLGVCRGPAMTGAGGPGDRYGVIAMGPGFLPTLIGFPAVLVAVWIGITVFEVELTT
jgi:hypothetical protein